MSRDRRGNARLAALSLLASVLDRKRNLDEAAAEVEPGGAPRDRAYALHLAYGVLRWYEALQWLATQLLQKPLKAKDRDVHRLLLLGLFQLWHDATAEHAAVHATAECARPLGKHWAVPLINAVLRRFQRERDDWLTALARHDARHSHPDWLLTALQRDWPEDWEDIVTANNRAAPLWLRLQRSAANEARQRLMTDGFEIRAHPSLPEAVRIRPAAPATALPGFAEGLLSVQDPAAQLAAGLLLATPGQRVLDACAAPGGKTCHLLDAAPGVELTAIDRSADRLKRVRENLQRLGYRESDGLRLAVGDAANPDNWWDGRPYQRILLDAPCSATGVIRRHPEIKCLRSEQQVAGAVATQAGLLQSLWPLLERGGMLLYATCSVLRDENDRQIGRFVAEQGDAELNALAVGWGRDTGSGRQIFPGEQDMDGFFYARLRKV